MNNVERDQSGLLHTLSLVVEVWRGLSDQDVTLDEVLEAVPQLALDIVGGDSAVVFLADHDHLVPRATAGHLSSLPTLPIERSLVGLVLRSGEVLHTGDLHTDPRVDRDHPPPPEARSALLAPVVAGGRALGVVGVFGAETDSFRPVDARSIELFAVALGALIRRITVETELRAERERFMALATSSSDAVFDLDLETDTAWWSEGYTEVFGWPSGTVHAAERKWEHNLHPDDRERVLDETARLLADPTRVASTLRYRMRRADGTLADVVDRSTVVRRVDGTAQRMRGGFTDVTEQVVAEERARESQRLELLGQLTGGVAHDLNNVLTVVIGATEQLVDDLVEHPELQAFAEMARTAGARGAELSHQLLAFGRRQTLEPEAVEVDALVLGIEHLVRRTFHEDVEISLELSAGGAMADVDQGQLEQAVLDVCVNAHDAMPDGGELTITTAQRHVDPAVGGHGVLDDRALPSGRWIEIGVHDTGTGIPVDVLPRVFDPFFSTKHHRPGSGMGLPSVSGFMAQSGGHVRIRSEVGVGTSVLLLLPSATASDQEPGRSPTAPDTVGGRARILLVEDDEMVRRVATHYLTGAGHAVIVASTGPEALDVLADQPHFDLLFTDIVMPGGMTGHDLAVRAIERDPSLRVLLTSGYDDAAFHHDESQRSVRTLPLLRKPYRPDQLAAAIDEVLSNGSGSV